jgi:hypothetical protein
MTLVKRREICQGNNQVLSVWERLSILEYVTYFSIFKSGHGGLL